MQARLHFEILAQPDDHTCGPTCLQAIYGYYGDHVPLDEVIGSVRYLEGGGTLAALLGCHALERGYKAALYSFDIRVFDPTWFRLKPKRMASKLRAQLAFKTSPSIHQATGAYLEFLEKGGEIRFKDLTPGQIRGYLKEDTPILTGLSATYLYRTARELDTGPGVTVYDDLRGEPSGHFVVLCGYRMERSSVLVADPLHTNPFSPEQIYEVKLSRLFLSIMLGALTYDANLLVITR